jgi:hypothetical protein
MSGGVDSAVGRQMADGAPKAEMTLEEAMTGLPKDFGFFADAFRNQVQPQLAAREGDRQAAVKKQRNFGLIGIVAAIAATAIGFAIGQGDGLMFGGFAGLAGGFGIFAWGSMALNKLAKETKLMLIEPVSSQFSMGYQLAPGVPQTIHTMRSLGLVPRWDRSSFEDQLTGTRSEAPFEFFEAHLEEKRTTTDSKGRTRTTWVTVFRGQCLIARFPKPFNGITKVYRDMGMMNWLGKLGHKEPRVRLEDPVFEKAFEVYGTDQIEARFLLTPDFMERLVNLEKTFKGKQLRCAFAGGEMLLCVEGKNLLEPGSMYRKMDDLGRVKEILHDFAAIFLLIDSMCQRLAPEQLRPGQ